MDIDAEFLMSYRKEGLSQAVRAFLLGSILSLVVIVAAWLAQSQGDSSPPLQLMRSGISLVLLVGAATILINPDWCLRHYELAIGVPTTLAVFFVVGLSWVAVSDHHEGAGRLAIAMVLACWLCYGYTRLPLLWVAAPCFLASALVVLSSLKRGDIYPVSAGIYLVIANAIGIVSMQSQLNRERALFLKNRELLEAQSALAMQVRVSDELNRAKSRFLAKVSHDLRQPLGSVALYASAFRESVESNNYNKLPALVHRMQECISLVDENLETLIADQSREEKGGLQVCAVEEIYSLIETIVHVFAPQAQQRSVAVRFAIWSAIDLSVTTDLKSLREALSNLLSNAIKFSDAQRRLQSWVLVGIVKSKSFVRIDVRDNGVGIAQGYQTKIFDPYFRVTDDEKISASGHGLGLSIVRESIERLHGHRLEYSSRKGAGTRFSIYVPLADPSGPDSEHDSTVA